MKEKKKNFGEEANLKRHPQIVRFVIRQLFGYLNYRLPEKKTKFESLVILYGENGVGKTTILNIIYSLLCCQEQAGVKSYLARTPFREIVVELDNGSVISAKRDRSE